MALANPHPANISNKGDLIKDIKILDGCFELADAQNWVDSRNFLVLRREYNKIKKLAENAPIIDELTHPAVSKPVLSNTGKVVENSFGNRQEKILEVIGGNGGTKIGELTKFFPGVNRRTVLRDLDKLCQDGSAVRNGNGRGAYYVKNGNHDTCGESSRTMSQ